MKKLIAGAVVSVLPVAVMAQSSQFQSNNGMNQYEQRAIQNEHRTMQRSAGLAKSRYLSYAYLLSPDGIVTKKDVDVAGQRNIARSRTRILSQMMNHDLDGDGTISKEELDLAMKTGTSRNKAQLRMFSISGDLDGDGALGFQEVLAYAHKQTKRNRSARFVNLQALMIGKMDTNGDGRTTPEEIVAYIDKIAANYVPSVNRRPLMLQPRPKPNNRPTIMQPRPKNSPTANTAPGGASNSAPSGGSSGAITNTKP